MTEQVEQMVGELVEHNRQTAEAKAAAQDLERVYGQMDRAAKELATLIDEGKANPAIKERMGALGWFLWDLKGEVENDKQAVREMEQDGEGMVERLQEAGKVSR